MLELQNLTKRYKTKSEDVVALDHVNLTFGETGMVFVIGKSGSGKTTLLNVVGGLDSFDEGDLIIKGKSFAQFKQQDFDDYRNTFIGFVFQEYNLLDEMTVEKNVSLAMELQGTRKRDVKKINQILTQVDLEGLNDRLPNELSGGQKQRVAIARALVKDPKIILTDEPTGALDTNSGIQVMNLLKKLSRDRLVIIVSHNVDLARAYADRIVEMKDGAIERDYTLNRGEESKKLHIKELRGKIIVRRGVKLSEKDLATLHSAVEHGKEIQIVDDSHFYIEGETEKSEKKQYTADDAKFIKGRLGFGNTMKMGLSNLKIKPVRLVVTILLCAIAFSVFGLFDAMTIYDESRLTANTLKNSNVPSIVLTASIQESNGDEYKINVGKGIIDEINAETGLTFKGVYAISSTKPDETKAIANISKYYLTTKMSGVIEIADENELSSLDMRLVAGRLPNAFDEIALPSYYAMCLINYGYNCGDVAITAENCKDFAPADLVKEDNPLVLTLNKIQYKIVGIVDTGAIDAKYDSLLEDYANATGSLKVEFENYVGNSFNLYGFVKDGFVQNKYTASNTLIQYKNPSYYYDFAALDGDGNDLLENDIQYFFNYSDLIAIEDSVLFIDADKTTLEANEILVSVQSFERLYQSIIEKFRTRATNTGHKDDIEKVDEYLAALITTQTTAKEKLQAVQDMLDLLCNSTYKNKPSAFQLATTVSKADTTRYESDGSGELAKVQLNNDSYKIVGFYTGLAPSSNANTLVLTEEGMINLGVNVQQGAYNSVIAVSTQSTAKINKVVGLVSRTNGLKFACSNNVISIITLNHDALKDMSTLFLIASGVFAVFAIAMMANYISTSITNRHTQIGILRALGTSGFDVLLMFLAESLIIAVINIALSNALTAVGCLFLNKFFEDVMNISIPLAAYRFRQFWVITGLSLAVAILASLAPILKLSRKKPIETIKR